MFITEVFSMDNQHRRRIYILIDLSDRDVPLVVRLPAIQKSVVAGNGGCLDYQNISSKREND